MNSTNFCLKGTFLYEKGQPQGIAPTFLDTPRPKNRWRRYVFILMRLI
jgi:hypothetical protein